MAQPLHPAPTGNPLHAYSVTPINGTEDITVLKYFKDSVLVYLRDTVTRDNFPLYVENFPVRWRSLLLKWVVTGSKAFNLLNRPDYATPLKFLDSMIARRTSSSEKFSDRLRLFLVELAKAKSMDEHTKTIRDFADDFFEMFMAEKLLIELTSDFDEDLDGPLRASGQGWKAVHVQILDDGKASFLRKAVAKSKALFLTVCHRHFMMAMVAADTRLFANLEASQMPLDADPSDFADWIQEKILEPSGSKIFLTLQDGKSPLTSPGAGTRPLYGMPTNTGLGSGFPIANNTSPAPTGSIPRVNQRFVAPTGNGGNRGKTQGAPVGQVGGPPQNAAKLVAGATPHINGPKPGTKRCNYCSTHFAWSITVTMHDDAWCYRNPVSPKYDAAKAKFPPTK